MIKTKGEGADYTALALQGRNMRDFADWHQLIILANLESYNATLISIAATISGTNNFDQQLKGLLSVPTLKKESK